MKLILISVFIGCFFASCSNKTIADPKDYNAFLDPKFNLRETERSLQEIEFWTSRLEKDSGSYVNKVQLGYHYLSLFKLTSTIKNLHTGDSLLKNAGGKLNYSDPEIIQVLSQVAITKHEFAKASEYNKEAFRKDGSRFVHALLSFDTDMELGNFSEANQTLYGLKEQKSFNALIRKAKYQDHIGDLEGAIKIMETAFEKIKPTNKIQLYCWTLSNLADMYGHAGRIRESYDAYINVLKIDSAYLYALKGIAWIAYSHDGDVEQAKKILKFIKAQMAAPELDLKLAELAEFEGNLEAKENYIRSFLNAASHPGYGKMYNQYLIDVYTNELKDYNKALLIAKEEVKDRPTPETYSALSWVYYRQGNVKKAYSLYTTYIMDQTYEPDALLRGAYILAAMNKKQEAKKLFEKSLESSFELGPVKTREIKKELEGLNH